MTGTVTDDMRFEMKMPDLATTDSEIRIVRWIVGLGQKVERGQPLVEVETDKATMEVESAVSGVLQEVRSPAGEAVSVGQVIAVLEVEGAPAAVPRGSVHNSAGGEARRGASFRRAAGSGYRSCAGGMFARNRARQPLLRPQRRPQGSRLRRAARRRASGCRRASRRSRTSTSKPASTPPR